MTTKKDVADFGQVLAALIQQINQSTQQRGWMNELRGAQGRSMTDQPFGNYPIQNIPQGNVASVPDEPLYTPQQGEYAAQRGEAGLNPPPSPIPFNPAQRNVTPQVQAPPQILDRKRYSNELVRLRGLNPLAKDAQAGLLETAPAPFAVKNKLYTKEPVTGELTLQSQTQDAAKGYTGNVKVEDGFVKKEWQAVDSDTLQPIKDGAKGWEYAGQESSTHSGATQGELTEDTKKMLAVAFIKTGKMPALGMGGIKLRADILNYSANYWKEKHGGTPNVALFQANYEAQKKALGTLENFRNNVDVYVQTTHENMNLALEQSPKVPRTGSPLVNRFYQYVVGEKLTGDPELAKLETFIYTAAREYAKVTMGASASAAGLTDTAAKEAEKLINAAQNPAQLKSVITAMQRDMGNVVQAYDDQILEVNARIAEGGIDEEGVPQGKGKVRGRELSPQDKVAVEWAQAHKNSTGKTASGRLEKDVAAEILKLHGVQ